MKVDYVCLRECYIIELGYCSEELRDSYFIGFAKSINENKNISDSQKSKMMRELIAAYEIVSKR